MRASFLLVGLLAACGDVTPCKDCPPLEGGYTASWTAKTAQTTCTTTGPRPATLNFALEGSQGSTAVDGAALKGTIYDTWDFVFRGTMLPRTYTLQGKVAPATNSAPVRVLGTLTIRTDTCDIVESFTANKI